MPFKDKEQAKKYRREYMRKWNSQNRQKVLEIRKRFESTPSRKEYLRKWWKNSPKAKEIRKRFNQSLKGKEYNSNWAKQNPEKLKAKYKRYSKSIKGIVNMLKKKDKKKFGFVNNQITTKLIEGINKRDKNCVYCNKELVDGDFEYDHLNPFKPISEFNVVRSCLNCNRSKLNANVLDWLNFRKLIPSKLLLDLIAKGNQG